MSNAAKVLLIVLLGALVLGCRSDAARESKGAPPTASAQRNPPAVNEVVLRIRKLGGPDGKQVKNELAVNAPIGDEFNITEQVGMTQFVFRGKVTPLPDGKYRVSFQYGETSPMDPLAEDVDAPNAPKNIAGVHSTYELAVGEEVAVAGFTASKESLVLSLARS